MSLIQRQEQKAAKKSLQNETNLSTNDRKGTLNLELSTLFMGVVSTRNNLLLKVINKHENLVALFGIALKWEGVVLYKVTVPHCNPKQVAVVMAGRNWGREETQISDAALHSKDYHKLVSTAFSYSPISMGPFMFSPRLPSTDVPLTGSESSTLREPSL